MIAVIDVVGKNLTSLGNVLKRLNLAFVLTHNEQVINQASHIILPGVGTARSGMKALRMHGLTDILQETMTPIIGICLGMQLLLQYSEEGDVECLGRIPGYVRLLSSQPGLPVPHMGWNQLNWLKPSVLQQAINVDDYFYFVHSYAVSESKYTVAACNYGRSFSAIIEHEQLIGMQFHPEKSASVGMALINNALRGAQTC